VTWKSFAWWHIMSSHAEVDDMRDAATDCFPVTELFSQFAG